MIIFFLQDSGTQTYKQVAVVEHFFDIIYHVHVALGSKRCGRHAGQKRTYRTVCRELIFLYLIFIIFLYTFPSMQITETYAFLPREAVSKFLSLCTQCKKQQITENTSQIHVTMANVSNFYDNRYLTSNLPDTTLNIKHERNIGLDYKIKKDWEEEKSNSELVGSLSSNMGFTHNQASRTLFKPYENNNNNKLGDSSKNTPINLNINETLNYYQLLTLFYHNFNLTNSSPSQKQENIKIVPNNIPKIANYLISIEKSEKGMNSQKDKDLNFSCSELKIPTPAKAWTDIQNSPNTTNSKIPQLVTSTPETNVRSFPIKNKTRENGSEAVKQMTSTYLSMTRSLGLEDDDALNLVSSYLVNI